MNRVKWHDASYLKCGKMMFAWSHGDGSDVRAKWPACSAWRPADGKGECRIAVVTKAHGVPMDAAGGVSVSTDFFAAVYRRKREAAMPADECPFVLWDVASLAVWFDFMLEHSWRPLLAPGYAEGERWIVVAS